MKDKKELIAIIIVIIIIIFGIFVITNIIKNKNLLTFEQNTATSNIIIQDIEFKNITKEYQNGITSIRAEVYNNKDQIKTIHIKVILKDASKKEVASMIQTLKEIEPGKRKILQTGIMGDYSNFKYIEFKILSDEQLKQM